MKAEDSIKEIGMSNRTTNILLRMSINTILDFLTCPRENIKDFRQIGDAALQEIEKATQKLLEKKSFKELYKQAQNLKVTNPSYYPLTATDISKQAIKILNSRGIQTVQELLEMENNEVFSIENISLELAEEIIRYICEFNPNKLIDPFDSLLLVKNQALSQRAINSLEKAHVFTLNQLLAITEPELLNIKNIGRVTLNEILQFREALYNRIDDEE